MVWGVRDASIQKKLLRFNRLRVWKRQKEISEKWKVELLRREE